MITQVTIQNFKAIHTMGPLALQPFSAFTGDNGCGKSSVLQALRLLQLAVAGGLDAAFNEWGGLHVVRNYNAAMPAAAGAADGADMVYEPVGITIQATVADKSYRYEVSFNTDSSGGCIVEQEALECDGTVLLSAQVNANGATCVGFYNSVTGDGAVPVQSLYSLPSYILLLGYGDINPVFAPAIAAFRAYIAGWQFLCLDARDMGKPVLQDKTGADIKLAYDGRNIADYVYWLNAQGNGYLTNITQKLQVVLPYISGLQTIVYDSEKGAVNLALYETADSNKSPVPGWLWSPATLRTVALLAVLESPKKPGVLFIDDIENGLDLRSTALLIGQIQSAIAGTDRQVVVVAHSPYFPGMAPEGGVIVCEKNGGGTTFR